MRNSVATMVIDGASLPRPPSNYPRRFYTACSHFYLHRSHPVYPVNLVDGRMAGSALVPRKG
jgi:hypothetical protein